MRSSAARSISAAAALRPAASEEFERLARELSSKAGTADGLKAGAAEVERAADDLNRTFDERYRAIENFRPGDAPGQPMFS